MEKTSRVAHPGLSVHVLKTDRFALGLRVRRPYNVLYSDGSACRIIPVSLCFGRREIVFEYQGSPWL